MSTLKCCCRRINERGQGVGYSEQGIPVFASNWLVDEVAWLEIYQVKATYILARVERIENPSPLRETPFCKHFGKCGGCQLQHMNLRAQHQLKTSLFNEYWTAESMSPVELEWVQGQAKGYRTKLILPIEWQEEQGLPRVGFYQIHSRKLEPISSCAIHSPSIDLLIQQLPLWLERWKKSWPGFESRLKPWQYVHFIYARQTNSHSALHLAFGLKKRISDPLWAARFMQSAPEGLEISGLSSVIQSEATNVWIEGDIQFESGIASMTLEAGGYHFEIDPFAFQQVNPQMAALIKNQMVTWIKELNPSGLLELYCGAGVLANLLAKETQIPIVGVDNSKANILSAQVSAKKMGSKAQFYCEDALAWVKNNPDRNGSIWMLNPPRKGLGKELIDLIQQQKPEYLIYMACGQKALAKDASILQERYEIKNFKAYDMFAQTMHFETLSLWQKRS